MDEQPVKNLDDLLGVLEQHQPGDEITVTAWREGKTRKLKAKLGTSDD